MKSIMLGDKNSRIAWIKNLKFKGNKIKIQNTIDISNLNKVVKNNKKKFIKKNKNLVKINRILKRISNASDR